MAEKNYMALLAQLEQGMGMLGKAIPATMGAFGQLHGKAMEGGALPTKYKELMALAIAIAVRCEGCITYHTHAALAAGAHRDEVAETVGVAVLMGGGPCVVYGTQALQALDQFMAETA